MTQFEKGWALEWLAWRRSNFCRVIGDRNIYRDLRAWVPCSRSPPPLTELESFPAQINPSKIHLGVGARVFRGKKGPETKASDEGDGEIGQDGFQLRHLHVGTGVVGALVDKRALASVVDSRSRHLFITSPWDIPKEMCEPTGQGDGRKERGHFTTLRQTRRAFSNRNTPTTNSTGCRSENIRPFPCTVPAESFKRAGIPLVTDGPCPILPHWRAQGESHAGFLEECKRNQTALLFSTRQVLYKRNESNINFRKHR